MNKEIEISRDGYYLTKEFRVAPDFRFLFFEDHVHGRLSLENCIANHRQLIDENLEDESLHDRLKELERQIDDFCNNRLDDAELFIETYNRVKPKLPYGKFENVYDAATGMLLSIGSSFSIRGKSLRPSNQLFQRSPGRYNLRTLNESLRSEDRIIRVYRGLSSVEYRNVSPLQRPTPGSGVVPHGVLEERLSRIEHFRSYLKTNFSLFEDIFGSSNPRDLEHVELAFMQHFKAEAGLSPPLLDVTYDPLVALYFASLSPSSGKVGVVYSFSLGDVSLAEQFGGADLRAAIIPDIRRLPRQRALIFESASDGLIEGLVPYRLEFSQHDDIRFEDPQLGIDDAHLLDDDNVAREFCENYAIRFKDLDTTSMHPVVDAPAEVELLFARLDDYATSLHSQSEDSVNVDSDILTRLASFHISAKNSSHFPDHWLSWRNLEKTVKALVQKEEITPFDYYPWLNDEPDAERRTRFIEIWRDEFDDKSSAENLV